MPEDSSGEVGFTARHEQIQRHPGMAARRSWDALGHMHVVHLLNDSELLNLIQGLEQNINNAGYTMIGNVGPKEPREYLFRELLRRLHNYVASAGTLVDHTRNLTDTYKGTATHAEYRVRLEVAMQDDVLPFVKQLRNYVLHVGLPAVGFRMDFSHDEGMSFLVYVDRDGAQGYRGWSAPARRFLENSVEQISLRGVIEDYGRVIESLYGWLYGQFDVLHGAEMAEVNNLIENLNARRW